MKICVTGGTGFVGGHVVRALVERGDDVRVTFRDEATAGAPGGAAAGPGQGRRARPRRAAARGQGLRPRLPHGRRRGVQSAREGVEGERARPPPGGRGGRGGGRGARRGHLQRGRASARPLRARSAPRTTSTAPGELGLTYVDSKHEGEFEALGGRGARGGRGGDREPVVRARRAGRPLPAGRDLHAQRSATTCAAGCRRSSTAIRTSWTCATWPRGTCAPRRGASPGERYILGGHDIGWVELIERVAELSGVHHPLAVIPRELGGRARRGESLGLPLPISAEAIVLMAQNWRYSSRKARGRAGLPPAQAGHHPARDDRVVPRADRLGCAAAGRGRRRCRWPPRACGWPAGPGCWAACGSPSATSGGGWSPGG